jgi:hypothetical protein
MLLQKFRLPWKREVYHRKHCYCWTTPLLIQDSELTSVMPHLFKDLYSNVTAIMQHVVPEVIMPMKQCYQAASEDNSIKIALWEKSWYWLLCTTYLRRGLSRFQWCWFDHGQNFLQIWKMICRFYITKKLAYLKLLIWCVLWEILKISTKIKLKRGYKMKCVNSTSSTDRHRYS